MYLYTQTLSANTYHIYYPISRRLYKYFNNALLYVIDDVCNQEYSMEYGARKQCQNVYVSEDLTRRRSHLLYLARVERKAGRFKHCWSHDGRILVRLHDDRVRGVTTTGELDKLVNETPVGHH